MEALFGSSNCSNHPDRLVVGVLARLLKPARDSRAAS